MKLLLNLILLIIICLNNYINANTLFPNEIYISDFNGIDTNQCGNSTSFACKTIQGSINSLYNQFNNQNIYPYPINYQFTVYMDTSNGSYYSPPSSSTIDLKGYNITFQPYPNSNLNVNFIGGSDLTWFTLSSLEWGMDITFSNIDFNDCTTTTTNGDSGSFLFNLNNYESQNFLYPVSISFNNCNFKCQQVSVPIVSISNQSLTYDYSNAEYFSINVNNCIFGSESINSTLSSPYFNTEMPISLTISSSLFQNLITNSNSSILSINNGIVSIENSNIDSIFDLLILQTNNSKVIIDSYKDISSTYQYGMISLNSSVFLFSNLKIDVYLYNSNPISLITLSNSYGSIITSSLNTDDFIFGNVVLSTCQNTYLIGSINSNLYLGNNYIDGCGSALFVSSSTIVSNSNQYPYTFTEPMICNKDSVSYFSGLDINQFDTDNCGPSSSHRVGYIISLVVLSVVILILLIIVIRLFLKQHHHHHNHHTYRQI